MENTPSPTWRAFLAANFRRGMTAEELARYYASVRAERLRTQRAERLKAAAERVRESDAYEVYGSSWGHRAVPSACTVENLLRLASIAWKAPVRVVLLPLKKDWRVFTPDGDRVGQGETRLEAVLAAIEAA